MPADAGPLGHGEGGGPVNAELGRQLVNRLPLAVASKKLVPPLGIQMGLMLPLELSRPLPARLGSIEGQTPKRQGWIRKRN